MTKNKSSLIILSAKENNMTRKMQSSIKQPKSTEVKPVIRYREYHKLVDEVREMLGIEKDICRPYLRKNELETLLQYMKNTSDL